MKNLSVSLAALLMLLVFAASGTCTEIAVGRQAQEFNLMDPGGKPFFLGQLKARSMAILYFFDPDSRPSQEGLLSLDRLVRQYPELDLEIWAITQASPRQVTEFISKITPEIPVLLDDSGVSEQYNASTLLPVTYILGPELKVLDIIQGGGKAAQVVLLRMAERHLQGRRTQVAKKLSEEVEKHDPANLEAKVFKGYAALREGNLGEAEQIFKRLSEQKGQGEILAKEGLAMVYAKKGEGQTALALAREVEQRAPDRGFVHVAKGDVLYRQGRKVEAEQEYQKAVSKKEATLFQRALALNQLGRIAARRGDHQKAHELYDQAVDIQPYYVEAMTNKGFLYAQEGRWEKALQVNRKATAIDQQDSFAATLAKNAEKMLALQEDRERNTRLDELIRELSARYRKQEKASSADGDTWTSGPMVMTFIDFQEKGGLAEQDGLATVLATQLGDVLNESGRVQVVERAVVERLFKELNIGSSELADPAAALKIGRLLAARIIATGSLFFLPDSTLLNLRLIDTETSKIQKVFTRNLSPQASLDQDLFYFNREILNAIIKNYPLQGFVVDVDKDQVMINLGAKQGVVQGTRLEVLEEQQPIPYKGKVLLGSAMPVGQLEVVKVDTDLSYARIIREERTFERGFKVKEIIIPSWGAEKVPASQ